VEELALTATRRDVLGKKTRFLRKQGLTPIHLFGNNIQSEALQCDTLTLNEVLTSAGTTTLIKLKVGNEKGVKRVFVREVQKDVFGKTLLHVDFYQVKEGEKILVEVPLAMVGEAPAMKGKGRMLIHGITKIRIECLPDNVPHQIEVDLSQLQDVGQAITVKDLSLDPSITVKTDPDQLLVRAVEAGLKAGPGAGPAAGVEAGAPAEKAAQSEAEA
jgi:large subunit ribosomal protein L25